MKVSRKPDLLTVLALIVCIGVLVSTWAQLVSNDATGADVTPARSLEQKAAQLYRGNFIKV